MEHVKTAHEARDPGFVDLLLSVIEAPPDPNLPSPRGEAYSFDKFVHEIRSRSFVTQPADVQAAQRIEKIKLLESPDSEEPLPEKYLCFPFLLDLYESGEVFDRLSLIEILRRVPLVYGPWKALKLIFKLAEANHDTEVYGLLAARFDQAFAGDHHEVGQRTLGYLVRRAWRYLRNIGRTLPACYADVAVDFLVEYDSHKPLTNAWVFNHIFQHHSGACKRTRFFFNYQNRFGRHRLRDRAFPELWKRSPLPLFELLQRAKNDAVKEYAISALKSDFRSVLREIEPRWVRHLIGKRDELVHQFVVWILQNVPRFEQASFQDLELHEAVLRLLESPSATAREYASSYARTHARDLEVNELIRLANSSDKKVFGVAEDLLNARDPRKDIGLDAWGQLLETRNGHQLASRALRKHFGKSELTPGWFRERLLSGSERSVKFACERLEEVHSPKVLGPEYFYSIVDEATPIRDAQAIQFALQQLGKFDPNEFHEEWLNQLLLNSNSLGSVMAWVKEGRLSPSRFSPDFLKSVSFQPTFADCSEVQNTVGKPWQANVGFLPERTNVIFSWLADVRQFSPDQIGFEWLMNLVQRSEAVYHEFAADLMIKAFMPADFATSENSSASDESDNAEVTIDLEQASFLFTGKLATMSRAEAKSKVKEANGKNVSGVNKSLDFLVIGDDGSPLYGQGRKGSKQVKAESLNEAGAAIRVISETAFLQMLSGTTREFSKDAILDGCEQLWEMMLKNGEDSPLARFAIKYLRHHHPDICLQETDRPVDPGAEIPGEFLTFERVEPLLTHSRQRLRDLALEFSRFEFARWNPPLSKLVEVCRHGSPPVRQFIGESLLAEETPQATRWRLNADQFDAQSVYLFCQSRDSETRSIGMKLIETHPRLRDPEKLFMLTESPDRSVRAFAIRAFWSLYRNRGVKTGWRPPKPHDSLFARKRQPSKKVEARFGEGAPDRPGQTSSVARLVAIFVAENAV